MLLKSLFLFSGFVWRGAELYLREFSSEKPILLTPSGSDIGSDVDGIDKMISSERYAVLPEATAAFCGSRHLLYMNELRFRQMLNDVYHNDKQELVRVFVDQNGGIDPVALKCKVLEAKRLKGGQALYVIEGCSRVHLEQVRLEENGKGYLLAKVSPLPLESFSPEEQATNTELSRLVYTLLKVYLRLFKRQHNAQEDFQMRHYLCLSPDCIASRPLSDKEGGSNLHRCRIDRFSQAVSTLIVTTPTVMQRLFASSVESRLRGLVQILEIAIDELKMNLISYEKITQNEINLIMKSSQIIDDHAGDIYPPEDYTPLSLEHIKIEGEEVVLNEGARVGKASQSILSLRNVSIKNTSDGGKDESESESESDDRYENEVIDPFNDMDDLEGMILQ
jgi:hypothetical protein